MNRTREEIIAFEDGGTCKGCDTENDNSNKYCTKCYRWTSNEDDIDNYHRVGGYLNPCSKIIIPSINRLRQLNGGS